ncbi:hypothetical protein [Pontibacter sp. G13]|uniref:hypothetical protein n=1 Tax=Pontibacter sp. G13 TaxID=3074898 RepID=UPI002889B258|nr:hypothetical protein [Pontibacter sp. G13]WNJ20094.1 hypothetical protein RJD25_06380 [Pontibacter sp. G13]
MSSSLIRIIRSNSFWLLIPILIWNVLFAHWLPRPYQPEVFWHDIPSLMVTMEHGLRIAIFALPTLMVFRSWKEARLKGWSMYLIGVAVYFLAWSVQMIFPASVWSQGVWGMLAPAYTPLIWLVGIAMLSRPIIPRFRGLVWLFMGLSICFVVVHTAHVYLVFVRL